MPLPPLNPQRGHAPRPVPQAAGSPAAPTTPSASSGQAPLSATPPPAPTPASDALQRAGYMNAAGRHMSQELQTRALATRTHAAQDSTAGTPGTSTLGATSLETADLELAAYFLARDLTRRPLAPAQEALLKRANQSKKEVLGMMPFGRSNVVSDLEATGNAGLSRIRAQRAVLNSISSVGQPTQETQLRAAALAAMGGAGCCGEFANLSAHVHAGRMQEDELAEVQFVEDDTDHAWTLVQGQADEEDKVPKAVLDVWGEGPVIDAADAYFCSGEAGEVQVLHTISGRQGPALRAQLDAAREPDPVMNPHARRLQSAIRAQALHAKPTGAAALFTPTSIVSTAFAEAARAAVERHSPQRLYDRAVDAVLRATPVPLARDEAGQVAEAVIDMARTLEDVRPRRLDTSGNLSIVGAPPQFPRPPDDEPPAQLRRLNDGGLG